MDRNHFHHVQIYMIHLKNSSIWIHCVCLKKYGTMESIEESRGQPMITLRRIVARGNNIFYLNSTVKSNYSFYAARVSRVLIAKVMT